MSAGEAPTSRLPVLRSSPGRALAGWPGVAAVSLAATVLSWRPLAWAKIAPGLDPSWQTALAVAFERHLQWGPRVVFTFGPYGFADTLLPFYTLTTLLVVVFAVAVSWGIAALVVQALRPAWALLPAGLAAWAVLAIANSRTGFADLSSVLALGLALGALGWFLPTSWAAATDGYGVLGWRGARPAPSRLVYLALLGALAGFSLLTKFNDGLVGTGLVLVAVLALGIEGGVWALGRAFLAGAAPFVAAFFLAWAGAGQALGNIPSYFRGSLSVAVGYSSAMGLSSGRRTEDIFAVVVVALLAMVFYLVTVHSPRLFGGWRALALAVCLAGWTWAALKEGFVRHDAHDLTFFGLALVALALARVERRYVAVQASAIALAAVIACVAAGAPPVQLHSPGASAVALADDVSAASRLGGFSRSQSQLRAHLLAAGNSLPPQVLSLVKGHSVAVEPLDDATAFEYPQLDWDPEPVLQGYTAYTGYLDHLDSSFLASRVAPERLVYSPSQVIDGRDPWMDPPATLESMYCHYVQVGAAGAWQVLGRVPSRCGPARLVRGARASFGEAVTVPRLPKSSDEMLVATLSFALPLRDDVEGVLLRVPRMELDIWPAGTGRQATSHKYRFVPGTAGDLHVLETPKSLGYSGAFTPPAVAKLALLGGGRQRGQGQLTVDFYAVPLSPAH